jgi:multidrug efflux pump subunit AcrB
MGHTVNVSVLLGVVIALGMLVDDAVVIVEAIYYRIERGQQALQASLDAIAKSGRRCWPRWRRRWPLSCR